MLVKVFGSAVFGIEATTITVEVNIDKGIGYHLVGLPDKAVSESSYRISAALDNNNFKLPGKKIIINMAPADIRKIKLWEIYVFIKLCSCINNSGLNL